MGKIFVRGWLEYTKIWGEALKTHSRFEIFYDRATQSTEPAPTPDDTLFVNGIPDTALLGRLLIRKEGYQEVFYVHDFPLREWELKWGPKAKWPESIQLYLKVLQQAEVVITQSHVMASQLEKILDRAVVVMDMCLDEAALVAYEDRKNEGSRWSIGYVSRLVPLKGQIDILRALSFVQGNFSLALAGRKWDSEYISEILRQCPRHVRLTLGLNVPTHAVYEIACNSDVGVAPSYFEGWGMFPARVAWFGKPLVLYDIPVFRELYGNVGIFVPCGQIKQLGEKLVEVLANYSHYVKEAQQKMSEVRQRWSGRAFTQRFELLIHGK